MNKNMCYNGDEMKPWLKILFFISLFLLTAATAFMVIVSTFKASEIGATEYCWRCYIPTPTLSPTSIYEPIVVFVVRVLTLAGVLDASKLRSLYIPL